MNPDTIWVLIIVGVALVTPFLIGWLRRRPASSGGRTVQQRETSGSQQIQSSNTRPIFIAYRREDTRDIVGRIDDHLVARFGRKTVFLDVDAIPAGRDFRKHIEQNLFNCGVVLAVIGRSWLTTKNKRGLPRLQNESDYLRLELEAALKQGIPIVPVLVQNAQMPELDELPQTLRELHFLQAATVDPDPNFGRSVKDLVATLEALLAERGAVATTRRYERTNEAVGAPAAPPAQRSSEVERTFERVLYWPGVLGIVSARGVLHVHRDRFEFRGGMYEFAVAFSHVSEVKESVGALIFIADKTYRFSILEVEKQLGGDAVAFFRKAMAESPR